MQDHFTPIGLAINLSMTVPGKNSHKLLLEL